MNEPGGIPNEMKRLARPAAPVLASPWLTHDRAIQLLTVLAGLPAVVVCLALLWSGDWTPKVRWTFSTVVVGCWLGCVSAVRERVVHPMRTLSNLLNALREGDYSLRSRRARRDDALGEVMREINILGETLASRRREAGEAVALLRAVMGGIDVAIFTFDQAGVVRLVNRAGAALLGRSEQTLVGRSAAEIGLADALASDDPRAFQADFPGRPGARWSLHRTGFREAGRPHQLLVLADVSQPLREEERGVWQRLIRVLGHEINNSLAPIGSIADSLRALLAKPEAQRASDWREDVQDGLGVIAGRSESLGRFMAAYSRLARLPSPERRHQDLVALVRRATALEARVSVTVAVTGSDAESGKITGDLDGDQIEQALINLIQNAADASLETGGAVRVNCSVEGGWLVARIEDDGPGLAGTANLFVPFFTTKPRGSGIGLVLSRQIVEAHGGTLTLEDRTDGGRGCVAALRLPAVA